jgi:chemotaxis protein MotB
MRDIPNSIQVEGFTDDVPIKTAVFPSNWELSAARAASVVHLLMKSGVRPERMTAIGYGEYRPAHSNDTEEGRNLNRRVVVVILGEDGRRDTDEDMISPAGTPKLNLSGIGHG